MGKRLIQILQNIFKHHPKSTKKGKYTYNIDDWNKALNEKDEAKMTLIVETISKECGMPNSYCLTQVFCPECPLGLLYISTGIEGYK